MAARPLAEAPTARGAAASASTSLPGSKDSANNNPDALQGTTSRGSSSNDAGNLVRPSSIQSAGVVSVAQQSDVKSEDVAEELTSAMVSTVLDKEAQHYLQEQVKGLETELAQARAQLAAEQQQRKSLEEALAQQDPQAAAALHEVGALRLRVAELETESGGAKDGQSQELPSTEKSEEQGLLVAAYQQIAVLNSQLAQLYTDLTISRSESQKQTQQIADLVGDIRHLQLDLEYHQQKLDHMIEEKQQMMKDLKQCRVELATGKQTAEEREQLLQHREVDIQNLKQELELKTAQCANTDDGVVSALRTEGAAKDSALAASHYELHKEKMVRDKVEQKNAKLMERMQKLMMVLETMRRENWSLEKLVAAKEKAHDDKELQLRQTVQKLKQLQKAYNGRGKGQRGLELQVGSHSPNQSRSHNSSLQLQPSQHSQHAQQHAQQHSQLHQHQQQSLPPVSG